MGESDVLDAIEVTLTAFRSNAKRERVLTFNVQCDDTHKVARLADMIGHKFGMALAKIDYDNPQLQQRRIGTSDSSAKTVGESPAPDANQGRDFSTEFEDAIEVHRREATLKNLRMAQGHRNDPKFRGFLFNYCKVPIKLNVVEAREWVRQKQHEMMKIDSCAKIYPGSYAENVLKWMASAFLADERNLPIPSMPEWFNQAYGDAESQ